MFASLSYFLPPSLEFLLHLYPPKERDAAILRLKMRGRPAKSEWKTAQQSTLKHQYHVHFPCLFMADRATHFQSTHVWASLNSVYERLTMMHTIFRMMLNFQHNGADKQPCTTMHIRILSLHIDTGLGVGEFFAWVWEYGTLERKYISYAVIFTVIFKAA